MLVRDRMSSPAITILPDTSFEDALKTMRSQNIRRLPIVDKGGRLAGIVSERDLLSASPSPATSLSIWEMNYLLAQLKVKELMTRKVITVTPDTPLEVAAEQMAHRKIGGMPVVDETNQVVGVITETDVLYAFAATLGNVEPGVRITVEAETYTGVLADLTQILLGLNGEIISVVTFTDPGEGRRQLVVKARGVAMTDLVEPLERLGDHVIDAREFQPLHPLPEPVT